METYTDINGKTLRKGHYIAVEPDGGDEPDYYTVTPLRNEDAPEQRPLLGLLSMNGENSGVELLENYKFVIIPKVVEDFLGADIDDTCMRILTTQ